MKKIFSFLTALLLAGSMMAQTNLFNPATATFSSWFGDGSWAEIFTSTAAYDATTGTITCNIHQLPYGQWHAQLKLQTQGITLDATKNYEFKCKINTNKAFGGVTIKVFDDALLSLIEDYALVVGDNNYVSAPFAGGSTGNGVVVFDLGNALDSSVVTISDIVLQESGAVVVADPQPAAAPAQPTLPADSVLAIYSNSYPVNPGWGYCEGWGQTTTLQELNLDGNTVLYYKNFNYLGWGCSGIVDASAYTKLHIDFWAPAAGSINVYPIYGGGGLNTNDQVYKTVNVAEGWNALEFDLATDFANLDFSSIFQFKFADAQGFTVFAVDNVYFYGKQANAVNYTSLNDIYSLADGDTVILKDFEVVYVNGSYTYIKDATASGLIYKSNYGLVAGDQVAKGMQAEISVFNNLYELEPITALADLTVTAGTPAQPALATAAPTAADNKYMVYKNVKFLKDSIGTSSTANRTVQGVFGRDTITFFNAFRIPAMTFDSAKSYDVTGFNSCYNANIQVSVATIEEHPDVADPCAGQHGLYDPATAAINSTYFATSGWGANAGCTADITNGTITIHVDQPFVDMWQGQVFVDPGFTFEAGKAYHYEFDITSAGKVCITVKVNDSDTAFFFNKVIYDINQGGGTYHFSTDSVFANANINPAKGPLVFGFGWTDGNQDITISCIKITEVGDAPEPVEEHMYIKHPWGTGIDADWTWQEMTATKYNNAFDAWTYTGAWGGVGFNIADNAEGNNAKWFPADVIGFRSKDGQLAPAPAVGTADCEFIYVPAYDKEGAAVPAAYVYYEAATGVDNTAAQIESVKIIRDGQLIIIRDGVEYNVLGLEIR